MGEKKWNNFLKRKYSKYLIRTTILKLKIFFNRRFLTLTLNTSTSTNGKVKTYSRELGSWKRFVIDLVSFLLILLFYLQIFLQFFFLDWNFMRIPRPRKQPHICDLFFCVNFDDNLLVPFRLLYFIWKFFSYNKLHRLFTRSYLCNDRQAEKYESCKFFSVPIIFCSIYVFTQSHRKFQLYFSIIIKILYYWLRCLNFFFSCCIFSIHTFFVRFVIQRCSWIFVYLFLFFLCVFQ